MLRPAFALVLAAVAMPLAPAFAADGKTLDCVAKSASAEAREGLAKDIARNLSQPEGEQRYSDTVMASLVASMKQCQAMHGWGEKAALAALLYAVPVLGLPTANRMAKEVGLDPAALEKRFMALPPNERSDALNDRVLGKLATDAVAAGEIRDNADLAGGVFGLLAVREQARSDFAEN